MEHRRGKRYSYYLYGDYQYWMAVHALNKVIDADSWLQYQNAVMRFLQENYRPMTQQELQDVIEELHE